ncbi:hypothetical protein ACFZCY_07370 [Streptomyces sp. NPDC007983]|uniref:hypothetical protein n=1 Tax=Streptomyces sp. NPDC007983 TaxID=3364800 RepID=UPI0036E14D8E
MPQHVTPAQTAAGAIEPDSLAELRGYGARMAPHWAVPVVTVSPPAARVSPSRIRGITVPAASADLVGGMSDYGD